MAKPKYYTDEQKAELLSNPYTARISDSRVVFTLAFKQLVIRNIDRPKMTAAKVFDIAGYSRDLFSPNRRRNIVASIRKEAASPEGLKEPPVVRQRTPGKKHSETEFRELQERVLILEQQIDFLKKSQFLKQQKRSVPPINSG